MTIQQLRYAIAVAELGSITEAAKELHLSQPSLSTAIRDLEKEVGIQIFNRNRSGISITTEKLPSPRPAAPGSDTEFSPLH